MKYILICLLSFEALAAGGGGPSDLVPSAVNVLILGLILVFLLKNKLSAFFTSKSSDIQEMMERAAIKAKEAEMMMEMQRKKISGAQEEIEKMKTDVSSQISKFKSDYAKEVDERIVKMKDDAGQKIEAEKAALMAGLNNELLDQVILKTKTKIKQENGLAVQATNNLIERLG